MASIQRSTESSSLAEVISTILDKGIVIDAWAVVSLVGIQILTVEARVVIASVETYLKYADAIGLTGGTVSKGFRSASLPASSASSPIPPAMSGTPAQAPAAL